MSRIKLFLVMIVFVFPMAMGSLLYHYREFFHFHKLNHGVLLNPVVSVNDLWKSDSKWEIVYVPQSCPTDQDEKTMFLMHQMRLILGNDSRRASLVLVTDAACKNVAAHDFNWVKLSATKINKIGKNKIILVDPKSFWFMSYPSNTDLMNVYNDLKRVFEVSQIG